MAEQSFRPPEERTLRQALDAGITGPAELILRLAWDAGLTRKEIHALTWDAVDPAEALLRLPDRDVPLDKATAEALERRRRQDGGFVAVSARGGRHLTPQSITALAKAALEAAGQRGVSLKDLRRDYIRRQLSLHDWPYVLRISGLSLESYRAAFSGQTPPSAPGGQAGASAERREENEYRVWRIMQEAEDAQVRVALWLTQQMGLELKQIAALTWEDVDFDSGTVHIRGAELPMPRGVRRILEAEKAGRKPGDDPHLVLSPRARRPVDPRRLSSVLRAALIRGGVDELTILDIRQGAARRVDDSLLLDRLSPERGITVREAASLLGLEERQARLRLRQLTESGELVRVGTRYYSALSTAAPERHDALVLAQARSAGSIRCQEAAELLRITPRQAGQVLRRMTAAGLLRREPGSVRYRAADGKSAEGP